MKNFFTRFFFILLIIIFLFSPKKIAAQQLKGETLEGRVIDISETGEKIFNDQHFPYQVLEISIERGSLEGSQIQVLNESGLDVNNLTVVNFRAYELGDRLRVYTDFNQEEERFFVIEGMVKRQALLFLLILFVIAVLMVTGKLGLLALVGLAFSFLVISRVLMPMVLAGRPPILSALISSLLIIPASFYLTHGIKNKTHSAVLATIVSLLITMLLAFYFVNLTNLTGFASEEAAFVSTMSQGQIDLLSLLFAGIMIAALGVLDDVTVGQASVVEELKLANPKLDSWTLFLRSMRVGRDHVSSMINTLILVYAGSAMPLLILFFDGNHNFIDVIELEIVAEEIVRTLVSSLGLMLAVPLTTFLSVFVFKQKMFKRS
ncbi:MAG: YibE/F family protein [Candidatus Pacebacteria bacterium]|nr:YibE/F family protein [Candidatus Paceibacterota bacterium]